MKKIALFILTAILLLCASACGGEEVYFPDYNGELYGYVDTDGEVVIDYQFDRANKFYNGYAVVSLPGSDKYGVINTSGKMAVKDVYDYINSFNENGYTYVVQGDKYGIISSDGKVVIPVIYDQAYAEKNGTVTVWNEGEGLCVLSLKGKEIVPFGMYDESRGGFEDDLLCVKKDGKWGFINGKGDLVIDAEYDNVEPFSEGFARVEKDDKYGFINTKGKLVASTVYESAGEFSNGLARVENDEGLWGYIDTNGDMVIEPQFGTADDFSEGLACVGNADAPTGANGYKEYLYGYINTKGELVIDHQFCYAYDFSEGLAWASPQSEGRNEIMHRKYGCIDKTGNFVIQPQFYGTSAIFKNGAVKVATNVEMTYYEKWGYTFEGGEQYADYVYVNKDGKIIAKAKD